ncbi:MAG: hypothetical protein IPM07_27750 [Anaerolineales bacterium]|nr:hypothetical protein [Anaerolineales bacterium]
MSWCRFFIVVTDRYVVLVDTLINPATARSWSVCAAASRRRRPKDAAHPAPIVASLRCAARFAQPDAMATLRAMQEAEPGIFGEVRLTPPTVLFDEQLTIDGGDLTFRLFAHRVTPRPYLDLHPRNRHAAGWRRGWCPIRPRTAELPLMRASLRAGRV